MISQHSVKILLQALCTLNPVKIICNKECGYSTVLQGAASSSPDHGMPQNL